MATAKTGYINPRPKWSLKQQAEILVAAGVPEARIWVEGRDGESLATAIGAARDRLIYCAGGMRALAGGRHEVDAAMDLVEDKNAVIFDPVANLRSDKDARKMYAAAVSALNQEQRGLNRRKSRLGGDTRAAKIANDRLPNDKAERIWKDKRFTSNEAACNYMNELHPPKLTELHQGWTPQIAYRNFKESGRPRGRKSFKLQKRK